eukprot:scaffold71091_cov37-Tisochrysis_lutea.AAC.1
MEVHIASTTPYGPREATEEKEAEDSMQKRLKAQLRHALLHKDGPNCWALVLFSEACFTATTYSRELVKSEGDLVRLISYRDGNFVFLADGHHHESGIQAVYHAKDEEFNIKWVGCGLGLSGGYCLAGPDLEHRFWNGHAIPSSPSSSSSSDEERPG